MKKIDTKAYLERYRPQLDKAMQKLKPLREYWIRQSQRDQQILIILGAAVGLMLILLVITSAVGFKNGLKEEYTGVAQQRIDAQIVAKQYKDLSQITPNDFSTVNSEKVKGDATQILGVKDADVILADNTLSIKATNVKFESVMLFLDQLRKSYGLFPEKLKITRLSQSGYVAFSTSFRNVEQQ